MKVIWNNCFFCLNELHTKTNDDLPLNMKVKRLKLILNYLIGEPDEKLKIGENVLKLWTAKDDDSTNLVDICDKCNDMVNTFVKLQVELEVVQMKIVEIIRQVRKVIVENSKYSEGENGGSNLERLGLQIFEDWEKNKNNYLSEENGKNVKRILETLSSFQGAVFKTGDSTIQNIPCIYLESYKKSRPKSRSSPKISNETPQADDLTVIKIDPECPLTRPLNPDIPDVTFEPNDNSDYFDEQEPPSMDLDLKTEPNLHANCIKSIKRKKITKIRISLRKSRKITKPKIPQISPSKKPKTPAAKKKPKKLSASAVPKPEGPRKKKRRSCDSCPFTTKSIFKFEFHLRKHEAEESTSQKSFYCAPCNLPISTKQYHDFHTLSHQGHNKVGCDLCLKKVDIIQLPQHMKGHFEKKEENPSPDSPSLKLFPCPNCSYCSSLREKYLDHLRDHHDKSGQFFCDICDIKVADRTKLLSHLYSEHNAIQKLTCGFEGCTMEYLDSFLLWNHQQKHKKQWICEFCGKACTSLSGLKVHERNHTGERPFPCPQCTDQFKTKPDLNRHLINVHDGEKFQCPFCDKQYKDPVSCTNHMRVHDGSTFPCEQCGQAFVSKHQLKRHLNSHSTERNFACEECGKAYRTKDTLASHIKTHTDDFNFKCTHCSKAFKRNQHLIAHLRTHTGERPFICDICGSSFTQAGPLINHKKKHL